jgi:hypothetical protein
LLFAVQDGSKCNKQQLPRLEDEAHDSVGIAL